MTATTGDRTELKLIPRLEAARFIGVSPKTFDKYRDQLKPIRFGRKVFFSPDVLRAFVQGERK